MSKSSFQVKDELKLSDKMSNENMNQHDGIQCDVCGQSNFRGSRYKCLQCPDFDMCSECFLRGLSYGSHQVTHPMQCILSQTEIELFFRGEDLFICFQKLQSLTCPYCGLLGLTSKTLMKHLIYKHQALNGGSSEVLCPICAARSWRNCNYTTNDLPAHLVVEHHLAGPASLVARINETTVESLRNPEADPVPTPAPQRQLNSRSNRNSMDAAFLELMSHLPDVRFDGRVPPPRGNSTNVQALQQIQFQLSQQQIANRPLRRGFNAPETVNHGETIQPSIMGPMNSARRASAGGRTRETALALQAALASEVAKNFHRNTLNRVRSNDLTESVNCVEFTTLESEQIQIPIVAKNNDEDDQFLLNRLLKKGLNESKLAKRDRRRADRSLFAQALLLSAFATDIEVKTETENGESMVSFETSKSIPIDEKKPRKKKNRNTSKRSRTGANNGNEKASSA